MKPIKIVLLFFTIATFSFCQEINNESISRIKNVAHTPPMGWNSFDAYDAGITEEEYIANVDYMAENLLEYGWEYAVIDYVWWHPNPGSSGIRRKGHPNIIYVEEGLPKHPEYQTLDEYGRFMPSVERFPSSADGKGFKPLADYVHSKGLKFGIHIMYGVPRYAWYQDLPILGTDHSIKDIAELFDTAGFCNHIYGIDASKPGAQEYYNSIFKLYAEWEVDFIKADGVMLPKYQEKEIEMMRKAIDNSGRDMVLSLSYGNAPIGRAKHMIENSNMWRISSDFWDEWDRIKQNFHLFYEWQSFIQPNHWPDGDMLPIGKLSLDGGPHGPERMSKFTWDEHKTLISLWSIAKSPLMLGADLQNMDDKTLSYITDKEVLYVNQHSVGNREVYGENGNHRYGGNKHSVWIARDPENDDIFLGLFNKSDDTDDVRFIMEHETLRGNYRMTDLWSDKDLGIVSDTISMEIPAHGCELVRLTPVK